MAKHIPVNCLQIPTEEFRTYKQADDLLSKYPKNTSSVVYYNPVDPSISCLLMSYLNEGRYGGPRSYILYNGFRFILLFFVGTVFLLQGLYPFKKRFRPLEIIFSTLGNIFSAFSTMKHCTICNKKTKEILCQEKPKQFLGINYQSSNNKPLCRRHLVEEFKNLFLKAKSKFLVFYPDLEKKSDENYVYEICRLSSLPKQDQKAWIDFFPYEEKLLEVPPGNHSIVVKPWLGAGSKTMQINLLPGNEIFLQCGWSPPYVKGNTKLVIAGLIVVAIIFCASLIATKFTSTATTPSYLSNLFFGGMIGLFLVIWSSGMLFGLIGMFKPGWIFYLKELK